MNLIKLTVAEKVACLEFSRPQVLNALSPALLEELIDQCAALASDDNLSLVILQGAGNHFSAGADLPQFLERMATDPHGTADLGRLAADAIGNLPQITLAPIRGYCIGGAIVLSGACDLRIAADSCRFSIPEVDAGIPLSWGGMGALTRIVGETLAHDLVISCRAFGPQEALRAGFVSRVIADAEFAREVQRLSDSIAAKSPLVLRQTKQKILAVRNDTFDAGNDAAAMVAALTDPATRQIAERYIEAHIKRGT
jgi:enoyl-CoA hydratase/carnithine racemase